MAAPSVVSISTSRAADDPAAIKDPWFRFFFGEQGENSDGEGEAQRAMGSGVVVDAVGYPVFFNGTALLGLPVLLLVWVSMRKMPLSA